MAPIPHRVLRSHSSKPSIRGSITAATNASQMSVPQSKPGNQFCIPSRSRAAPSSATNRTTAHRTDFRNSRHFLDAPEASSAVVAGEESGVDSVDFSDCQA
eukprot:scaffold302_cov247-Pinguiococcus_pyrenoidosus.AAC.7